MGSPIYSNEALLRRFDGIAGWSIVQESGHHFSSTKMRKIKKLERQF